MAQEFSKCIERVYLRDGREAEERVVEKMGDDGCLAERVIEVHAEPPRPKFLEQRVVEKVRPVVYERQTDTIKDGQVVEKRVEALDPEVKMELRQHLGMVGEQASRPLTKQDVLELLGELRVQPQPQVRSALQDTIAERVGVNKVDQVWVIVGLGVIACQVAALAYFLFIY